MLTHLSIKNYALIDDLDVHFDSGLTIITGETGAGKSILLDALSLVLGKRADLSSLKNQEKKCIIEAEFSIENYGLSPVFDEEDLDYEQSTVFRREILPSGKSRSFINDTPVNLSVMAKIGGQLIDIHSQHQTLQLTENQFQFQVLDALARTKEDLQKYGAVLIQHKEQKKTLEELRQLKQEASKEQDYNSFLLKELLELDCKVGEQEEIEEELETLSNVEAIEALLSASTQLLSDEQMGILTLLGELKNQAQQLSSTSSAYEELSTRIQSAYIELDDIFSDVETAKDGIEADPQRLASLNTRLQTILDLQKKHQVVSIEELLEVQQSLEEKVSVGEDADGKIEELEVKLTESQKELDKIAQKIHEKRKSVIPSLTSQLEEMLSELGMKNARFAIDVVLQPSFLFNGKDELRFLFSANKGGNFGELKKVASGGELSRIMLSIKAMLSRYEKLPTIIFDEIDTGVSGEISNKIADIMQQMSDSMQVFTITHLPQVAAKGHHHYKVYKEDKNEITSTYLKKLSQEERIVEIAQMLGGVAVSDSAIAHAKQLLN